MGQKRTATGARVRAKTAMPLPPAPCFLCNGRSTWNVPFGNGRICLSCKGSATTTASQATRGYRIPEEALAYLPVWVMSTRYHDRVRRYLRTDIEALFEQRYGRPPGNNPRAILDAMDRERLAGEYPAAFLALWFHNGRAARGIASAFQRYQRFVRLHLGPEGTLNNIRKYVVENQPGMWDVCRRTAEVETAIVAHGLSMPVRGHAAFAYIDRAAGTIEDCIRDHFLWSDTEYVELLKTLSHPRREGWQPTDETVEEARELAVARYTGPRGRIPAVLRPAAA